MVLIILKYTKEKLIKIKKHIIYFFVIDLSKSIYFNFNLNHYISYIIILYIATSFIKENEEIMLILLIIS